MKKSINYCNYNQMLFHSLIQTVKEKGGVEWSTHILMAHVHICQQIHTRPTHMHRHADLWTGTGLLTHMTA